MWLFSLGRKCWQDLSRGGNFHDTTPISLIKSYGFYFLAREIFARKAIFGKTRKLPPSENFHVFSNCIATMGIGMSHLPWCLTFWPLNLCLHFFSLFSICIWSLQIENYLGKHVTAMLKIIPFRHLFLTLTYCQRQEIFLLQCSILQFDNRF